MTFFRFLLSATLLGGFFLQAQEPPALLRDANPAGSRGVQIEPPPQGVRIPRARFVEVDPGVLLTPVSGRRRISLPLFADTQFLADELRSSWSKDGSTFLWVGQIEGMQRGQVILAATGDIVSGSIMTDTYEFYSIRQVDGRLHRVQQVQGDDFQTTDDVRLPPETEGAESPDLANPKGAVRGAAANSIDLMVCYTTTAKNAAGGEASIRNKIELAVGELNQSFVNSAVGIQVNLVHTMEVNYNDAADVDSMLAAFRSPSDGQMDEVHAARNTYGADLVHLLYHNVGANGGTIGVGYLMRNVSTNFASNAFSISEQYWMSNPGWAMAHELGHNMGSTHDRANTSSTGAYPYSYGYQHTTSPRFRTIMSYACPGSDCPRIPYWSNPDVTYSGAAVGVDSASAQSADNARSLNNTAATVANFRQSVSGCSFTINPTSASYAASGGNGAVTITAGTGCAGNAQTSSSFLTITSSSSGSGSGSLSYSVAANTGGARSDTITVAGQTVTISQSAAPPCSYSISPASASFSSASATASVSVTAGSGCNWSAGTSTAWITINSGASGTGSGFVNYAIAANTGSARNGSMTIAGQAFSVSQSAGVSTVTISVGTNPSGLAVTVDGVSYTTPRSFSWQTGSVHTLATATQGSNTRYVFDTWSTGSLDGSITITTPASATGYSANFRTQHRLTTTASPSGGGTILLSPSSSDGYFTEGSFVQAAANAGIGYQFSGWTGAVNSSSNPVTFAVNSPASLNAGFSAVPVCGFTLGAAGASVLASGDILSIDVSTTASCVWSTSSSVPWITVISGGAGSGNGRVGINVAVNGSPSQRTGVVSIGGASYEVTQSGAGCTFSLSGPSGSLNSGAGTYSMTLAAPSGCAWKAFPSDSWITLTGVTSGNGSANLTFSVTANSNGLPRSGAIIAGGQWSPILQKSAALGQAFSDVPVSHTFFDYIGLLSLEGVSQGCGGGSYCPDEVMTRGEMAAFIIRALYGEAFTYSGAPYFNDVSTTHAYFKYIQKMRELGITVGCTTTTYCPAAPVTRGEMSVFLVRARLGLTSNDSFAYSSTPYFNDVPPGHVFYAFIQKMKELGITAGCTANSYCAESPNTRGQMAVFVTRNFY
jgi:hypothetical protein